MNTDLMVKAQTLLYNNQDRLEALVEALESFCNEGNTLATPEKETPYTATEEDIGSLCEFFDDPDEPVKGRGVLTALADEGIVWYIDDAECSWRYCKPVLKAPKLHFTPHKVKYENDAPKDIGKLAVLLGVNNDIFFLDQNDLDCSSDCFEWNYIKGYCNLEFVIK